LKVLLSDVNSDNGEDLGYLATKTIFSKGEPVTAIFAGEDSAARGAYKALRDRGIRIPEDISVAGFNDTSEASALSPPLTSAHVFTDQLGRQMAELVMNRIARPDLPPQVLTLPTRLVKRESCCALSEAGGATVAPSLSPPLEP
ncbi:MAG: LacI family DNA-binding transcriptional regulator, partial [Terriglobia bacterium]